MGHHSPDTTYGCLRGFQLSSWAFRWTRPANHEGFAFSRRHDLYPLGLFPLAFHVQVTKCADVVGQDIIDIFGTDTFEATAEGNWVTTESLRVWVISDGGMTFASGWHRTHDESDG